MGKLTNLFKNDIGIDLGTANMRLFVPGEGIVFDEPSCIAVAEGTGRILAVGEGALRLLKNPPIPESVPPGSVLDEGKEAEDADESNSFTIIRPMKSGVIADFDIMEKMIRFGIAKINAHKLRRPRAEIAVSGEITEVEKRAVKDAAMSAGAREVFMIEETMAAAIGAGLPVAEPNGRMVVDIGAGTTKIALVSLAGIVCSKSLRVGGDEMNAAIITYVRERFNLLIDELTAEDIKIKIGSAWPLEHELKYEIKGRDAVKSKPISIMIDSREIREKALAGLLGTIEDAVEHVLRDIAPPEIAADLVDSGMTLTGGGALLTGIDHRLAAVTQLPVRIADDPIHATIHGAGRVLDELV